MRTPRSGSHLYWRSPTGPGALREREPQFAEVADRAGNLVARLEPHLLLLGHAKDHPRRSSGEYQVARLEREMPADVRHEKVGVVDQRAGVGVLAGFAVDAAFDIEVIRILD